MPSHHIRSSHKTSQVAPAHSSSRQADEPIVESKRYLKLRALTSEKVFPTLEGLAEEKGLDVEHHDIPAQDESHSLAPSAWSGKLPEIVKKDAEFTQADTIIINEPEQVSKPENQNTESREAELKKIFAHNDVPLPSSLENHELAPAAWQSSAIPQPVMQNEEANDHVEMPEEIPTDSHLMEQRAPSSRNKKRKDRKRREAQEEEISKPSETLTSDEPIAESKANLKPQALKSEQIFPTLEGLAEEKGLDTYIDDHNDENKASDEKQAAVSASEAPAAWQGKLPEVVKQDAEFTKADVKFVDEPAERAAAIAKYKQERKERRQALKTGPLRWFKGEPRETSLERLFVRGVSGVLGVGFSLVCGFLRIFGLRDLSGRLVMGCRNFVDNVIEGTFLRHLRSFGHQWWMYRLVVRVVRNIDRNVRARIGPEPGKDVEDKVNELHREAQTSLATAKREASRLRDEATEVLSEARERIRSNAAAKK